MPLKIGIPKSNGNSTPLHFHIHNSYIQVETKNLTIFLENYKHDIITPKI